MAYSGGHAERPHSRSAFASGSGKTVVALALAAALRRRGVRVVRGEIGSRLYRRRIFGRGRRRAVPQSRRLGDAARDDRRGACVVRRRRSRAVRRRDGPLRRHRRGRHGIDGVARGDRRLADRPRRRCFGRGRFDLGARRRVLPAPARNGDRGHHPQSRRQRAASGAARSGARARRAGGGVHRRLVARSRAGPAVTPPRPRSGVRARVARGDARARRRKSRGRDRRGAVAGARCARRARAATGRGSAAAPRPAHRRGKRPRFRLRL